MTVDSGRFAGMGTLHPVTGSLPPPISVEFSFDITSTPLRQRPGLPPPPARLHGRGNVSVPAGVSLDDGIYRLRTSDGREERVQKLGADWFIVGSP